MIKGVIFDWYGTLYEKGKGLFPSAEDVLKKLKARYKIGLVCLAKEGVETRRKLVASTGLSAYFDSVIIDTEKNSEHYLRCMKEMKTSPENTAIVDDRTVRGIKVGNELGCITFWIKQGEYSDELPNEETGRPSHVLACLEELLKYV